MKNNLNYFFKTMKISSLTLFFFFCCPDISFSQISINSYIEVGNNNVSEGIYANYSAQVSARFGSFTASTGGLLSFSHVTDKVFSAYLLQVANEFRIFKLPVNIAAFYFLKPFSVDFKETNIGILTDFRSKHVGYSLGLNSRVYSFTAAAKQNYNIPDSINTSIWEPINLMYRLTYYQRLSKKWDFEACVTNFDSYIIEQETNPMIITKFSYKIEPNFQLYSDIGYMQTDLLNRRIRYFGVFFRGGVKWRIN